VADQERVHVLGISGGKDSTALWCWALRTNLSPIIPLFNDTGWEAAQTYAYLDVLEQRLGPLRRTSAEGFEARARRTGTFPSRVRKWCSPELKVAPTRAELDCIREETGRDVVMVVGVRAEESRSRSRMPEREWSDAYDCEVWRPLISWTLADVVAEHHRASVPLNPLYQLGAERVGCWPCIHARKSELRLIADIDSERIERVAAMESDIGQTMFAIEESRSGKSPGDARRVIPTPIRDVIAWSRTARGGAQLAVIPEASGCARWGICEAPGDKEDDHG